LTARQQDIDAAAAALAQGRLVAFATETVYGLGADATSDKAVAKVFAAKGRPEFNPLIVHVACLETAERLGVFNDDARLLARTYWPGPLTLVVPRTDDCPVSKLASAGLDTIALRVPSHPHAQALLKAFAGPVVAPSANRSGAVSPTTAEHVRGSLGDAVDLVLDGGACAVGIESTIIACTDAGPVMLRPGGISRHDIEETLGRTLGKVADDTDRPASPGRLPSHYAPRADLRLNAQAAEAGEALLAFGPDIPDHTGPTRNLSTNGDVVEAAANLFRHLHELDATGVGTIAVMTVPRQGLGEAINDRLERAAAPRDGAASR